MTIPVSSKFFGLSVLAIIVLNGCGPVTRDMPAPAPTPAPPPPIVAPAPPPVTEPPKAEDHHVSHWTYSGDTGATHWGELSPEWTTCKTGTSQSPIDLETKATTIDKTLGKIEFSYTTLPLSIFNNGHTVQVPNTSESGIKVAGQLYKLVQFHLHSPSEHLIDGKPLDLELHLVHKNDQGLLTVVGVLFKKGKENKALSSVFANAPIEVTDSAKPVEKTELDLAKLLPSKHNYYMYSGSLTTPPCTEGVNWIVMQAISEVSDAQLAKFREVTHGDTVRPVQPLGSRKVSRSP
jgi:carbonic anhydrase